jgi:hypothetical protein
MICPVAPAAIVVDIDRDADDWIGARGESA